MPGDPSSSNPKISPLFNGYSASGDVTAPVVYANYGLPDDYEELKKAGVDVKGKIVIVRYGNSFRGVKAKVAEDHGAIGCIIYSDPADDGYMQGDVFPKGPWRPVASGQRGSVQYLFDYPGDPLTPGKPCDSRCAAFETGRGHRSHAHSRAADRLRRGQDDPVAS